MKKCLLSGLLVGLLFTGSVMNGCDTPTGSTSDDTPIDSVQHYVDSIIALKLPTWQNDYVAMKFGMFIHFSLSTFCRYQFKTAKGEWELGNDDKSLFHPESLDIGKWVDVAKSAHCRYAVITTKHHGGFCLWPSKFWSADKPHSIEQTDWYANNGQRDILKEFVDSCRAEGIKPGFYYSVWDRTNAPTIDMVKGQLTELLTNYGDIVCIWFDGWGWKVGYEKIPYDTVANLVHRLNVENNHNTIIVEQNHAYILYKTEIVEYEMPIDGPPKPGNTLPAEGNTPLRADNCWFWHPEDADILKLPQTVVNELKSAIEANATYLLDVTPDTLGMIPANQVQAMSTIGDLAVQQGILSR